MIQRQSKRQEPISLAVINPNPLLDPAWRNFVDDMIPTFVKEVYSPKAKWATKPFGEVDARFFSTGIRELSDHFTELRPSRGMISYFDHPKYRSSYLLYFLPLQAAKFLTLFTLHPGAMAAMFAHAEKSNGVLRVADLGAGPGTASLALLFFLLQGKDKAKGLSAISKIELNWFDVNLPILSDGHKLIERMVAKNPALKNKIDLRTYSIPWWKALDKIEDQSIVLLGNVLNEGNPLSPKSDPFWQNLFSVAKGAGTLFVEPAAKKSSQLLSHLRDHFFEAEMIESDPSQIWGPCLHTQKCPLSSGRDWCHFSVPVEIPGKWFKFFSQCLGSERQWLKFSYLWISGGVSREISEGISAGKQNRSNPFTHLRRVISDPIPIPGRGGQRSILLCEPERPGRLAIPAHKKINRGDLVKI